MTEEEVHAILTQVTEEILERIRRVGFDYEGVRRFDPIIYDINNGWCEEWAYAASEIIPGSFPSWVDEDHCVLVYEGRFYDADCLDGVDDVNDLPMLDNPGHPRPEP